MKRFSFLLLACPLSIACGGSEDPPGYDTMNPDGGSGGTGSDDGGPSPSGCEPEPLADAVEDVSGRWALLEITARLARAPGIVEPIPNQAIFVQLLEQTQSGDTVTVAGEYCDHWVVDPESLVHTLIPDAYKRGLEPFSRTGSLEVDGDGVVRYRLDELVEVIGAELDDPKNDALPTDPDDPRVVDQDADGQPGVTVRLSGIVTGEVYAIDRRIGHVDVVAVAEDRFLGSLNGTAVEVILASDPPSIKDLSPEVVQDPDTCRSRVELVKVPDDADCAWVNENVAELFPDAID